MAKQMAKSLTNPIRYKTFTLTYDGVVNEEKALQSGTLVKIFESKGLDASSAKIHRFIGTSESKDRDGEIALLSGWDFNQYIKNPVVLWGHIHTSLPIGKTVGLYKDEARKVIYFDIQFSESYDFAKTVKGLVDEGILNATSVGFRVLDWDYDQKTEALVFTKMELFEISIVNVPANQDALLQDQVDPAEQKSKALDENELAELIARLVKENFEALAEQNKPSVEVEPEIEEGVEIVEALPDANVAETAPTEKLEQSLSEGVIESIVERVTQAVLINLNTKPEEGTEVVADSSTEPITEVGAISEPEPEPIPEPEPEAVVVGIEELSENIGFIIVTEEEK